MHKKTQWETLARRLDATDGGAINPLEFEMVPASTLRGGDLILCTAGDVIPAAGEVVADGAAVIGEARVLSGWVAVRIATS